MICADLADGLAQRVLPVIGALLPSPAVAPALTSLVLEAAAATCLLRKTLRARGALGGRGRRTVERDDDRGHRPWRQSDFPSDDTHLNDVVSSRIYPD